MVVSAPHIAFVDDEPHVVDGFRRVLSRERTGWRFSFFTDPQALLDAFVETPFDVVVSDMKMPGMSGLELAEMVRKVYGAPCIILTGAPDLHSVLYAVNQADVFRFYTKPCGADLLCEGIAAALEEMRGRISSSKLGGTPEDVAHCDLTTQIGLAALNRLALSVLVLDQDRRVLFTNQSAAELLAEGDGLVLGADEVCRASARIENETLKHVIGVAIDAGVDTIYDTNAIALTRPSMKRPLSLFATPLSAQIDGALTTLVALFISDPDKQPVPTTEQLMSLYGLTRSEAVIVGALSAGARIEAAAEIAGVTVSTARTYLKQVFSKTETSRQSELLKLVLATPAVLAA